MISNLRFCFCKPEKKNFYHWLNGQSLNWECLGVSNEKSFFITNSKRNAQVKSITVISSIIIKSCIECYFWPKGNHKFSILLHKMRILIPSENSREEFHFEECWCMVIKKLSSNGFLIKFWSCSSASMDTCWCSKPTL